MKRRITQQQVLDAVRDRPGSSATELAATLGCTRMCIDQHLWRASDARRLVNLGGQGGRHAPGAWHPVIAAPRVSSVFDLGAAL